MSGEGGVGGGGITHVLRTSTCLLCVFCVLVRAPHCLFAPHLIAFAWRKKKKKVKSPSSAIDTLVIQRGACALSLQDSTASAHNMHPTTGSEHIPTNGRMRYGGAGVMHE